MVLDGVEEGLELFTAMFHVVGFPWRVTGTGRG